MAATILLPMPPEDGLYRLSGAKFDAMVASGLIGKEDRVELIDGILHEKMTQNAPHATVIVKLNEWLVLNAAPLGFRTRPQVPIRLADNSRPEPDLAVVRGSADDFPDQPTGEQVLLAIEIADTSSERTLRKKARLYAQNGVQELWVVDVQERRIELHREPAQSGYRIVTILAETEPFAPLFLPGQTLRGADILPKT